MTQNPLFQPLQLAPDLELNNRLVMAPLTRCMADDKLVSTEAMAAYYGRRADTGLIISEAILVSADGQGYPNTPGIFSAAQIAAWQDVTRRVHEKGGKIFAQLWHTGRVSHPVFLQGEKPMAPSAVAMGGRVPRMDGLTYEAPRAMTEADIARVIADFGQAAANAKQAGFDGVEIHGANGYLIDQFLHFQTNQRSDRWGGSVENMSRFLFAVIDAVKKNIDHVGLRLSPVGYYNLDYDAQDFSVFEYLLPKLKDCGLCYLHTGRLEDEPVDYLGGTVTEYLRRHYSGPVIANGGYSPESAAQTISDGGADLVAIGRPIIANPDYVKRVGAGEELIEYNEGMLAELY